LSEFTVLFYEFNGSKSLEKTTTTAFTDAERNDEENQPEGGFRVQEYFGSGLDDAVNGGTTLYWKGRCRRMKRE